MGDVEPAAIEIQYSEPLMAEATASLPTPAPPSAAALPPAMAIKKPNSWSKRRILSVALGAGFALIGAIFIVLIALNLRSFLSMFGNNGAPSNAATAQGPDSAASSGSPVVAGLGVDIYPGATSLSSEEHSTLMDKSIVSQSFESSDTMTQVIDFYKARMVGMTSIFASGNGVVVSISPKAQDSVVITISPAQSGGKTRISISHSSIMSSK